jgi:hypothetical protein
MTIAIAAATLCAQTAAGMKPAVKEIRMTSEGMFRGFVVDVGDFELIVTDVGTLDHVERNQSPAQSLDYRFTDRNIERTDNKEELWYFEGTRLRRIGTVELIYNPTYRDKLDKIGELPVAYRYLTGKVEDVERIGDVRISYEYPKKRLEYIGNIKIEYNYMNKIEKFRPVTGKPENPKDLNIRIEDPFPVLKQ